MAKFAPIVIVVLTAVLIDIAVVEGWGYYPGGSASTAAGGVGGQYTQNEGSQETHNDKNLGFTYGSKQGSSSNFKNTGAQAGAYGAQAQVKQPYWGYPQYPVYPPHHGWGPTPPPHGWVQPPPTQGWGPPPPTQGWGRPPPTQGWGPPPPTQGWGTPTPPTRPPTLPPTPTPGWTLKGSPV